MLELVPDLIQNGKKQDVTVTSRLIIKIRTRILQTSKLKMTMSDKTIKFLGGLHPGVEGVRPPIR